MDTKEQLLKSGYETFLEKGYNGAGLSDILKRAGVPKGSFYHYFENKEAFLIEVLSYYERKSLALMSPFLEDETKPAMERFHAYISSMIEICENSSCKGGCLSGNIAQEMSDSSEEVREKIRLCFQGWGHGIQGFFKQAQSAEELTSDYDVEELVNVFVDGWQGALLRMKVEKKTEPLHRFLDGFLKILGK